MNLPKEKRRVAIIIQARMGSTRYPGKPLKTVAGKPLLGYLIDRVKAVKRADRIVVATSIAPQDAQIAEFCQQWGVDLYRGSEQDVLDRYYQAAKAFQTDIIVRITGDCPLIDPKVVDQVIEYYLAHVPHYDYVSNMLKPGFPRGMDVEIFSFEALQRIHVLAKAPEEREHVTLYLYEHPDQFAIGNVSYKKDLSHHRWTVDTEEDFQLVSRLLEALSPKNPLFTIEEIENEMNQHPDWFLLNAQIKQKPVR